VRVVAHAGRHPGPAGQRSSVSNGVVEAFVLPHTMRFNVPVGGPRLGLVVDVLDDTSNRRCTPDERAIAAIERTLVSLGVPARLHAVGVEQEALPEIVRAAIDDWSITRVPKAGQQQDIADLLEAALWSSVPSRASGPPRRMTSSARRSPMGSG
jgi:alcohol dehydrogenase class IV